MFIGITLLVAVSSFGLALLIYHLSARERQRIENIRKAADLHSRALALSRLRSGVPLDVMGDRLGLYLAGLLDGCQREMEHLLAPFARHPSVAAQSFAKLYEPWQVMKPSDWSPETIKGIQRSLVGLSQYMMREYRQGRIKNKALAESMLHEINMTSGRLTVSYGRREAEGHLEAESLGMAIAALRTAMMHAGKHTGKPGGDWFAAQRREIESLLQSLESRLRIQQQSSGGLLSDAIDKEAEADEAVEREREKVRALAG
ncbi:MAG: hypothetical protein IBX50_08570 [Marinospirillum sp.]|uniref:hypothetical protein n=1 Tax=Marinospirillum sp. TaxID=2183934 RepID=UPI0019DD0411|nr:hypothetical protein [Marinospirillum sp.]MBE0506760.1 hypothetical protein [Marinospirillum sp.]